MAEFVIPLYYNLDTFQFTDGLTGSSREPLTIGQSDVISWAVRFVRSSIAVELTATPVFVCGLKLVDSPGSSFLIQTATGTKTGTGSNTVYTFTTTITSSELSTQLNLAAAVNCAFVIYDSANGIATLPSLKVTILPNPNITGSAPTSANGTWVIAAGKAFTVSNTITLTGTDGLTANLDRLANLATGKVLGRTTAGTGAVEELSISGTGSVAMTDNPAFNLARVYSVTDEALRVVCDSEVDYDEIFLVGMGNLERLFTVGGNTVRSYVGFLSAEVETTNLYLVNGNDRTTVTSAASGSNKTASFPNVSGTVAVAATTTTATHALFGTATAGAPAYRAVAGTDLTAALKDGTIERTVIQVTAVSVNATPSVNTTKITTATAHGYAAGDKVIFSGLSGPGGPTDHAANWTLNSYNPALTVATSPAPTSLEFYIAEAVATIAQTGLTTAYVAKNDSSVLTLQSTVDTYGNQTSAGLGIGTITLKHNPAVHDAGTAITLWSRSSTADYSHWIFSAQTNLQVGSKFQVLTGSTPGVGALVFDTGPLQTIVQPYQRASGSTPYFVVTTPADITLAASTECIGSNFTAATRQFSTGTIARQRERVFAAPTYSFVGASTVTEAINVDIALPATGTNATFTSAYALRAGHTLILPTTDYNGAQNGSLRISPVGVTTNMSSSIMLGSTSGGTGLNGAFTIFLHQNGNSYFGTAGGILRITTGSNTSGNTIMQMDGTTCAMYGGNVLGVTAAATNVAFNLPMVKKSYTVATLPASPAAGWCAFVTDALAPVFGSNVAGSGAVGVPVYYDGSNWKVG